MYDAYGAYQASSIALESGGRGDYGVRAVGRAVSKFHNLRMKGMALRALSKLTGRSRRLLDLEAVRRAKSIDNMYEAGCVTVEVKRIKGSECRVCDFDSEFCPMNETSRQRWASVYAARLCGVCLPAISLVQVGDVYYVRDGHHRVSVARVLGEEYIEANVQVWQVEGEVVTAPAMSMQLVTVA